MIKLKPSRPSPLPHRHLNRLGRDQANKGAVGDVGVGLKLAKIEKGRNLIK